MKAYNQKSRLSQDFAIKEKSNHNAISLCMPTRMVFAIWRAHNKVTPSLLISAKQISSMLNFYRWHAVYREKATKSFSNPKLIVFMA